MRLEFDEALPISARREEIAAAIRDHQVVVVAGETGSGKTTQLPKICLQLGRGRDRVIGHTQPRRIAARSVAERIAEEVDVELGGEVGYQVRFTGKVGSDTRVKLMTDGILLAELQHDRTLAAYDTLIIDEAHERSLNIDFILGYLKRLLPRRPDLRVVITSATIDPDRFARHFADPSGRPAPVIEVSGRTYPVEVRYRPLLEEGWADEDGEPVVRDQTEAVADACRELVREGPGDILVFLPGEREIRDTADVLADDSSVGDVDVLPLFARLSAAEQHRVFEQHRRRRIVLATNVAETSLTVPGIRYVVDTGLARISRYSARSKVQRLPIEPVSQASAQQRSGRCGRVEAGVAIRLYSEEDYEARPRFTDPEILRTSLASVILQMAALRLGDVGRFPFVDPPDRRQVNAGVQLLEELGAVRTGGTSRRGGGLRLTGIGRRLAGLPIDPRLGRMVLEADRRGVLEEVLVLTAALSVQDPRERPAEHRARADQMHARFRHPRSDFLTLLNLWDHVRERQGELGSSAFRRMCRDEHLNYLRLREWQDLEGQLRQTARQLGMKARRRATRADNRDEDGIHRALLAGLLSHLGMWDPEDDKPKAGQGRRSRTPARNRRPPYLGARGARFAIFPGSGLARKPPAYVMAAELVETSRLFARTNAAVDPAWAEELGAHLVKRTYSEPHWSRKRAAVMAYERVTLYGVPLASGRLVTYGSVDRETARELFLRHALVQGEWDTRHRFFHRNRRLLEEAEELEHRARRRDLVVDEDTLFDFYDARVGAEVVSGVHFDTWWKTARREQPDLLTFDPQMLVTHAADEVTADDYPDTWLVGDLELPLRYHFQPGAPDDGVVVEVPLAALNQVGGDLLSWQVPGLREELVIALLRSLPKQLRTSFVPVPDHARDFLASAVPGEEPLLDALERHLRGRTGVHVPREAWDWTKVPPHLRPVFRVVDDDGSTVTEGRGDLASVTEPLGRQAEEAVTEAGGDLRRSGENRWVFGEVPRTWEQVRAGHRVTGHPGLVDEGTAVGLQVFAKPALRDASHRRGVTRLLALTLPDSSGRLLEGWDNRQRLALAGSPYPTVKDLLEDCRLAALGEQVDRSRGVPWDEASFEALRATAADQVGPTTARVLDDVTRVLAEWREVDRALAGSVDLARLAAMTDMRAQVGRLVGRGFVFETGADRLRHLTRYLAAVRHRREQLDRDPTRDQLLSDQVAGLQQAYLDLAGTLPKGQPEPEALRRVRWLLEELRVSLWAQHLGTAEKVSDARVRKALAAAREVV